MSSQKKRKQEAKVLFETVDPRNKIIQLDTSRYQHIVSGHWQFRDNIDILKKTVEEPIHITQDKNYQTTQNYFKAGEEGLFKDKYIKVAVDISTPVAFVKTAFILLGMDKVSEEIVWTSQELLRQLQEKLLGK